MERKGRPAQPCLCLPAGSPSYYLLQAAPLEVCPCVPAIAYLTLSCRLCCAHIPCLPLALPCTADGLAALYRTGIHFFLLAYCGSNLREAARLLKACHLGSTCADVAAAGRQLAQRSILGGLLPGAAVGWVGAIAAVQCIQFCGIDRASFVS